MKEAAPLYDRDSSSGRPAAPSCCARAFAEVDAGRLAEEIEAVGKRDRREVRNRLKVLLVHLLKWMAQPGLRYAEGGASGGLDTIREQRAQLESIFEQSPSLAKHARESLDQVFCKAVEDAVYETRLPPGKFPTKCPFAFEQLTDKAFLPN
jgi:hypothetical protein